MKALVYDGPRQVSVKDVPDAKIERPTDVLVRITAVNICGSDLHMYEGRTDFETGRWFGHENLGEVIEVGDRVVLPFNVACGHCKNCERGLTNYCLTAQPVKEWAGAAYGFADMARPGAGQEVQPAVARPDRRRQGRAVIHRQPRAAAGPGTGGLLPLRRPGRRLDQGRAQAGTGQRMTGQGDVALLVRVQPVDMPATTLPR